MTPDTPIRYEQEPDGRWLAVVEVYPGVMAYGRTKAEAGANALRLMVSVLKERLEERRRN